MFCISFFSPSIAINSDTMNFPLVSVPVLSVNMCYIWPNYSFNDEVCTNKDFYYSLE